MLGTRCVHANPVGAASSFILCTLLGLVLLSRGVAAQVPDTSLWGTGSGSNVLAVARSGNTLFIGGSFLTVGPSTGGGVPVDPQMGAIRGPYPRVGGGVGVATSDSVGGWFIGGKFAGVGGLPRWNLAHIKADGSVDPWTPDPDGEVLSLVLHGGLVYVGGRFNRIGGQVRNHIAAFDVATGRLTDWAPEASGVVWTILPHGDTVYVGGSFGIIGGELRSCIAALDATTGRAAAWNPGADSGVEALALHGRTLYVGGAFYNIGGRFRRFLAELSLDSDSASTWNMGIDQRPSNWLFPPGVEDLKISGNTLYVGGIFTDIGGQKRNGLAAIDLDSRQVTEWAPEVEPGSSVNPPQVRRFQVRGTTLYASGVFRGLGGRISGGVGGVGAVDTQTGLATAWDPRPNGGVGYLCLGEDAIYVGGGFTSIGPEWVWRNGLAALDLTTGRATSWDPRPDEAYVLSLAANGHTLYVGGAFSRLSGEARSNLAAFDTRDGNLTPWNPAANGGVTDLAVGGNTVYAGGQFTSIGGQPRHYLAAIDSATGTATPWDPDPDDFVEAVTVAGNTVYVGGWFAHMRGWPQHRVVAAIDAATGEIRDWQGERDGIVDAIAVREDTVYVGGLFSNMGGQPRRDLAAIDGRTGFATEWHPVLGPGVGDNYSDVKDLQLKGNTLYAGGFFGSVNGVTRNYLAALDATTGAVVPGWDPNPDGYIWAMTLGPQTVYAGGGYERMNGVPVGSIAALDALPTGAIPPPLGALTVIPNPVHSYATLGFALTGSAQVTLAVFDLQGRRRATLLNRSPMAAGEHVVPLETSGWPAGCYLARLEVDGRANTCKLVVLRQRR